MADNTSILIFKAITSFISDLDSEFGKKYKSIQLYSRLLEKTGIVHIGPINKHIDCFRNFFIKNHNAMLEQDEKLLEEPKISYSDRVYVDISVLFKNTNAENSKIIWQHLLTIWGLIDPTSEARRLLKQASQSGNTTNEEHFLTNIIDKVENAVSNDKIDKNNPISAISSLMQSGVMSDLVTGMQKGLSEGSLDVGRLMMSVQTMMGKMSSGGGSSSSQMPDLSQVMSMVGPMISSMSNPNQNTNIQEEKE
jgi:hypothetical protein